MRNNFVPRITFYLILSLFIFNTQSLATNWNPAKEGNKIILIRHSIAPGGGDPPGFKVNDCKTQRNLSKEGIKQSKKLANYLKKII